MQNAALAFDAGADAACRTDQSSDAAARVDFSFYDRLEPVESEWRRFERAADCTPFQTFDWLFAWLRHIGRREEVQPVIAVAAFADGATACIFPLAIDRSGWARRLCWLGQDINDYNAPLVARDFAQRISPDRFRAAWNQLRARMQRDPRLRHDWIELEKMPQMIGGQLNPFFHLPLAANPSGAHFTRLGDTWEKFYTLKRSSATRRRDRAKRKRLAEFGEISFVTSADADDARRTLEVLIAQKGRLFASRGIPDMFARPGWREFFLDLAAASPPSSPNPFARDGKPAVHISRVQFGALCGAANLGLVFRDTYYHMLASYDDGALAHYGPGALHLRELLAYAIGLGLRRFDFTIGDEAYKLEWSDTHIKLGDYASAASWRGFLACGESIVHRRLKRFVKQTPAVWHAVSQLRSRLGPLLQRLHRAPRPAAEAAAPAVSPPPTLACVMGDMDLLRPLAAAGIGCAVVTRPGVSSLYSRYTRARLLSDDFSKNPEALVEELLRFGKAQHEPPVLFYEEDAQLLLVSRFRDRLAKAFRFVVADAPLVDDLVDKARFQTLAERHGLPVPPARRFDPAAIGANELDLRYPVIVKPLTRLDQWNGSLGLRKALLADGAEPLQALWPQLVELGVELLAQEFVAGTEAQIESYHCYVDRSGAVVGEFTGRKIRTYPAAFGHTTALEITEADDVQRHGRAIAERLGLTGVAKFDFKRDGAGALHLLEINPRFNLWHHAGAVAGVNIPALVFADLTGTKRPPVMRSRAGVRWCRVWKDFPAARAAGVPFTQWLSWVLRCETQSSLSWDDPLPLLRAGLHRLFGRRSRGGARTKQ
jgi:D-aspartate ligase